MKDANRSQPDMITTCVCTRRSFLQTVIAGAIGGSLPAAGSVFANVGAEPGRWPAWLPGITGERDAVVRLGKAYLATHPGEQQAGFLIMVIEHAAATRNETDAVADPEQVVAELRRVVGSEYLRGDVVLVNRWILSTTEARLYGLVAALAD